jgi:hypothetical protein
VRLDAAGARAPCLDINNALTSFLAGFLANPDQNPQCIEKAGRDGSQVKPVVLHQWCGYSAADTGVRMGRYKKRPQTEKFAAHEGP